MICGIQADRQRTFAKIRLWKHCFPAFHNFFKYGNESSTERKLNGTKVVCVENVPRVRKFHVTKILGTFAPEERKFCGCESSMERKFLDFSLPSSKCSTERKFHGSESSLYGLFAPGNDSAEERKGQIPGAQFSKNLRKILRSS